ncbi:MAG: hypothetical protein CME90_05870 [Hoeflea sp.]|nr:hypothetical protein [Hoeflea sp.]|tara:strand:+ start:6359 stop:6901 length:543 start_codon:yes stop_codon:yes gene_type:complete
MIMSTKPNLLFSQPDTIAIARVPTVTFNTWRKRNGLFPRTTADKSWNYYTGPEVMVARTVAIMSRAGLSPKVAIKAAMDLLPEFERVWEDTYRLMAGVTAVLVEDRETDALKWVFCTRDEDLANVLRGTETKTPLGISLFIPRVVNEVMVGMHKVGGTDNPSFHELYEKVSPAPFDGGKP